MRSNSLQQGLDGFLHLVHAGRGLEASYNIPLFIDQKLREVPFDIGLACIVLVFFLEHGTHGIGSRTRETFEAFLALQIRIERRLVFAIHLDFIKQWEFRSVL